MFAVSPDGRHIALVVEDADGRRSLWVRPTNDLNARPLRGTEGALAPFWSPDSRSIGFATSGRLKRVEIAGGLPVPICPLPVNATEFSAGSWAPDGTVIFSTVSSQGVLGVSAKGDGQPQQITEIDRARGERIHTQPSFLPDGRHFLYLAGGAGEPLGLYVASLDGADRVRVLERGSRALFAAAHLFFTRDQELVAQPFNLDRLTLEGEVTTVADVINVGGISGAVGAFSVSAAGAVLYQGLGADSSVRLEWRDRDGTPQGTLGDVGSYIGPELSPDGLRTAIQLVGGEPGNRSDLLIFDNTRQRSTQFTSGPGQERFPVWSPDGNRLAFAAWEPSTVAEHRLRVKALAAADDSPLIAEEIFGLPTSWSRDNVLLFTRTVGSDLNRGDVFSVSLSGEGRPRAFRATPARELGGVFSPDGRWIAYSSNESGRDEVYVAGFQDAADPQLVSSGGGLWAQWRSNGRELFYLSLNGELMAVDVTLDGSRLRFGKPRELFPINIGTPFAPKPYSPASDGQKFLITTSVGKATPAPLTLFVRRW
jgi:Tol biopolymer transport system component